MNEEYAKNKEGKRMADYGIIDADDDELITAMQRFKDVFGDIVPLRALPQNVSNEDLIAAINDSIEQNRDLLPERFRFEELESNKNILM